MGNADTISAAAYFIIRKLESILALLGNAGHSLGKKWRTHSSPGLFRFRSVLAFLREIFMKNLRPTEKIQNSIVGLQCAICFRSLEEKVNSMQ